MKIAIMDFDGTLNDGKNPKLFFKYMFKEKMIPKKTLLKGLKIYSDLIRKKVSYDKTHELYGILWAEEMKAFEQKFIKEKAKKLFPELKKHIYPSTYELIDLLKEKGYYIIIMSTSPQELIDLVVKELKVDEGIGFQLEVKNGKYTGKIANEIFKLTGKKKLIKKLKASKKYDWKKSIIAGDSIHEAEIFPEAEISIALNPQSDVKKLAKEKGWLILNKRNIVEKLKELL